MMMRMIRGIGLWLSSHKNDQRLFGNKTQHEISACELSLLGEIFFVPFKYTSVARGSINHGFVAL